MASTTTTTPASTTATTHIYSNRRVFSAHRTPCRVAALPSRRQSLLMLTLSTAVTAVGLEARAVDVPLFGIRKTLKKVEETAEEIVKEGVETAEKELGAAETEIVAVEKDIEIAAVGGFGGLPQAGVVVGAEALGVLVATSVVNGILGPRS